MDDATPGGVRIHAIGGTHEGERCIRRRHLLHAVGLIHVGGLFETGDGDLMDVCDRKVGMQSLFEDERGIGIVDHGKLQAETATDCNLVSEAKVREAQIAAQLCWGKGEGQVEVVTGQCGEGQCPRLDTSKAVRWARFSVVPVVSAIRGKPRKGNRDTTTDRLTGTEVCSAAEKEDRSLSFGLPMGQMGSLKVDRGCGVASGNFGSHEAIRLFEAKSPGDGEVLVEGGEVHSHPVYAGDAEEVDHISESRELVSSDSFLQEQAAEAIEGECGGVDAEGVA